MNSIGVIGLGNISIRHRQNLKSMFPATDVIAMSASGRSQDKLVEFSDKVVGTVDELIKESPIFVIIASPASLHLEHSVPLIKENIPVLIEKPVTTSSEDAEYLVSLVNEYRTPVSVGYCLRYLPSAQQLSSLLDNGVIGKLYNVFVNTGQFLPQWRTGKNYKDTVSANVDLGGGVLFELSHELDYMQWLMGNLSFEYAYLRSSHELGLDVEDSADIVLTSDVGTVCSMHLDFLQKTAQRKCIFVGSEGRLEWDLIGNSIKFYSEDRNEVIYEDTRWDKNQMYIAMIEDFVSQIKGLPHNCIGLNDAAKTVGLIELIKREGKIGVSL